MSQSRPCVGIPKEIKPGEYRVAGLPEHVRRLREMGAGVLVQRGAGAGSGYPDAQYERAGAEMVESPEALFARADLLWKVKEILPAEFGLLRAGQVVFAYLHPAPRPRMVEALRQRGCTAITYEDVADDQGRRPLLVPMSRLAGTGAIAIAGQFSQSLYGGVGKCLFAGEGAEPLHVTILGAGVAGRAPPPPPRPAPPRGAAGPPRAAAAAALGAGASVTLLEVRADLLADLHNAFPRARVRHSTDEAIRRALPETDALINCTYWMPGDPHLVTREMLALMPRGSLIVDVAADPHGAIETSEETTHDAPIRVVDGVLHYCVQNIPSLFGHTASGLLSEATWPYLERMVRDGVDAAIEEDAMLRRGVVLRDGVME